MRDNRSLATKVQNVSDECRHGLVRTAYDHYSMHEFKTWAADLIMEMGQQVIRISTDKCKKEDLIKNTLMVEDMCCMIHMLAESDKELVEKVKCEVYSDFAEMMRCHGETVPACCTHLMAPVEVATKAL